MKERIEAFLQDLDRTLASEAEGEMLDVYHIGRSALVWKYAYSATTKDVDILCPQGGATLLALALRYFGKDSKNAMAHGLYLGSGG